MEHTAGERDQAGKDKPPTVGEGRVDLRAICRGKHTLHCTLGSEGQNRGTDEANSSSLSKGIAGGSISENQEIRRSKLTVKKNEMEGQTEEDEKF